ncbi:MAG: glycosyltransferase family 39 protein [Deltaproteobacteria bacterium]|nr:glycosyltransferase family 39 protein [Deltaproteobacteria bacterium]
MTKSFLHHRLLPALAITCLLLLAIVVLGKGIDEPPLVDWDEATYAEVAHEALVNHSYLDFTWNGQSYLKKPPLLFWTLAASFKTFGENEFSARLPSVIMGIGTLLLVYRMVASEFGPLAGLLAGIFPLGFYFFVARGGRECATDAPLIFFSTLAIFGLLQRGSRALRAALIGLACGLALLSKGAAGLISLSVVMIAVLTMPDVSDLGISGLVAVLAVSTAIAAPWFLYQLWHNGPVFWTTYIKDETLLRIAKHLEDQPVAAGFTAHSFISEVRYLWPLVLPLTGLVYGVFRRSGWGILRSIPAPVRLWGLWFAVAFAAACAVQTKLGWYILPALIPVALLSAAILAGAFMQGGRAGSYCRPLAITAVLLLPYTAARRPSLIESSFARQRARSRPSYEMARRAVAFAAVRGGGELYFAGPPLPTMVYYSGMRCHFVSPSEPEFELADLGGNPISVSYNELVLRDSSGTVVAVDNLNDEWNATGPRWKQAQPISEQALGSPHQDVRPSPE